MFSLGTNRGTIDDRKGICRDQFGAFRDQDRTCGGINFELAVQ